jgi:hypothetical protein
VVISSTIQVFSCTGATTTCLFAIPLFSLDDARAALRHFSIAAASVPIEKFETGARHGTAGQREVDSSVE